MKKQFNNLIRVYNGAQFCDEKSCCPVVDYSPEKGSVKISDPAKPRNGTFTMSIKEFNTLIKNAQPIK